MKAIRGLILFLLALLLIGAVVLAFLPARMAADYIGNRLGPVQLGQVDGTIWHGTANPVFVNNEPVGVLTWELSPLAILAARVDATLVLRGDAYNGDSAVSVQRDRTVRVRDLSLRFPARKLEPVLDIPALVLRGEVHLSVPQAELMGGFPKQVQGTAVWKDAAVAGSAEAQFGEVITDFASTPVGGIAGTVRDNGGPLQAQGGYEASLAGYTADITLRARDGNPQVTEALQYIGQPQPDGSAKLEIRGKVLDAF